MSNSLYASLHTFFKRAGFYIRRHPYVDEPGRKYSYQNEQGIIAGYLAALHAGNSYCVDIAAGNGTHMSNTYSLFKSGYGGLAVEFDPEQFSSLVRYYEGLTNVDLSKCKVTPLNVESLLAAHDAPEKFAFLSLDIDGYDYFVLEAILSSYRPTLICAEINEKIPPPIKFTVKWDPSYMWAGDHFYGQSISQLYALCTAHKYSLIKLHYNNAFLVPAEYDFAQPLTPETAYKAGYVEMPDRKGAFRWNSSVEELLTMRPDQCLSFLKKIFEKYEGRYELSL